jgi:FSR family fosmidomycin resistance protein-like MFS transporter
MTTYNLSYMRNRAYLAVSLTHFFVDVLNNSRTLLVAIVAVSIGLTNAEVGIALLLYNIGSALLQPVFGWMADRFGPRWLVVGGMGWMIGLYGVAAVAPDWPALVAITLAGLGSGAFHPTGAKVAGEVSTTARNQATAVFFTAGQLGLFVGPVLAGGLLDSYGRIGFLALPFLALLAFGSGLRWLSNDKAHHAAHAGHQHSPASASKETVTATVQPRQPIHWPTALPLTIIILSSSTIGIAAINFAPKLFTELGYAPAYVGWTAGLFMMGSAIGGIIGGALGDRIGRKLPILIGFVGSILPLIFYIPAADPWRFILLLLAGFFAGMPHSILVIMAQALMPGRRATASGLILGMMFFSGAIGSLVVGWLGDQIGLGPALQWTAVLPVVALVATLMLPGKEGR